MDYLMKLIYEGMCIVRVGFWRLKKDLSRKKIEVDRKVLLSRMRRIKCDCKDTIQTEQRKDTGLVN